MTNVNNFSAPDRGAAIEVVARMFAGPGDADGRTESFAIEGDAVSQCALPVSLDIPVAAGCDRVILTPCKGFHCMADDIRFTCGGAPLEYAFIDGFRMGSMVWFANDTPRFEIRLPEGGGVTLHAEMTLRLFDTLDPILKGFAAEYNDRYVALNVAYTHELKQLREGKDKITKRFETVMTSSVWKATWPVRKLLDVIKQTVKDNERLYEAYIRTSDGLRCALRVPVKLKNRYFPPKPSADLIWPKAAELARQRGESFPRDVKFSILVPLYNTPGRFLREMIASVRRQSYGNWELCLADGSDARHPGVGRICAALSKKDARIKYRRLSQNLGISGNTNACIDMATGDFIALFDHDDLLHPSALYEMMKVICEKDADFVYTDETTFISPNRRQIGSTHYKPDFSPDNLLTNNYICHFTAFDARLLEVAGRFRSECDGSQDHDLFLRLTHAARHIEHIPKVLYWWRSHPRSVAQDLGAKQYTTDAGKRAVRDFLRNTAHIDAQVESTEAFPNIFEIRYPLIARDSVSIVIPHRDQAYALRQCVNAITSRTRYDNYEIVIVDTGSTTFEAYAYFRAIEGVPNIRLLKCRGEANAARLYNRAVAECRGETIVLMDPQAEVINPEWLENMLMYAQRKDVGAVGPKISLPDGRVQQAGIVLNPDSDAVAMLGHHHVKPGNFGYMGRLYYAQDVSAVSAACMMIRRDRYLAAGGMDEAFAAAFYDVDLCLRLRQEGLLNIYTPFAELRRPDDPAPDEAWTRDRDAFRQRWADVLSAGDPCYNPNFRMNDTTFDFIVDD